ncbi:MAG: glycosyltransferase family 2 protein [Bacteroidota bacterium]
MPRVSIGLPIYNGELYLRETLDSLLAQTYADFELLISDNGSTDGTQRICEEYAARDPRVKYYREAENRGAAWNYNRVVELATGEYFKWAAHDDLCAPTYLEKCIEVLDRDPGVVLCFPDDQDIDKESTPIDARRATHVPGDMRASSPKASERLRNLARYDHDCEEVFGLVRLEVLRKTRLIQSYTDSDRTLLGELGLYGRFHQVPEPLFLHRHHSSSSCRANPVEGGWHERARWFDPGLSNRVLFSQWRQLWEYSRAIMRAPLGLPEKAKCFFWLGVRYRHRLGDLGREAVTGVRLATQSRESKHVAREVS